MSILSRRILGQGAAKPDYHPYGTGGTPMVMPLALVRYEADSSVYYEAIQPVITADGAVIPAAHRGTHPPVIPAGQA